MPFAHPLGRLREYVEIVRMAMSGERISYQGEHYVLPRPGGEGKALKASIPPRPNLPIHLATLGPKSLELTGELADGWIGTSFIPEQGHIMIDRIKAGAKKAGRNFNDIEIQVNASVAIDENVDKLIEGAKMQMAFSLGAMGSAESNFYNDAYSRAGFADDAALIMAKSGEVTTWSQLRRRVVQAANTLHDLGLRHGDSVAFSVENRPDFAVLLWAAQDAGYRYTPISTRLTSDEVAYIVNDCGAKIFLHSDATASGATGVSGLPIINIDQGDPLNSTGDEKPRYERAEGIAMLYSSGTTGHPKGIWRPAPEAPIDEIPAADMGTARLFGYTEESVYLSTAPLYHSAPITFLIQCGRLGVTTVIEERFDALASLEHIERYGVTHSQWVPTMFVRLLRLSEEERNRYDLSSHVFAIHGAGPCSIPVKQAMIDWWGPIISEYYAGTEGVGMCVITAKEWLTHKGSVGRSIRGPIRILDDDGNELPVGEPGQVWFGNTREFKYLNDVDKTATVRRSDGKGTFGDLGYLDAEGYLNLTGRIAFTIIVGGINVYPREIEDVLSAHEAVGDVAVFGIPDEEYGEQVRAVVELAAGKSGSAELEAELIEYAGQHLATFKLPRTIVFVDKMPREQTGKLRLP